MEGVSLGAQSNNSAKEQKVGTEDFIFWNRLSPGQSRFALNGEYFKGR